MIHDDAHRARHATRARIRYLAAIGLSGLSLASTAAGCREPIAPEKIPTNGTGTGATNKPKVTHTEMWIPDVPLVDPPSGGPRASCPHGPFCVPKPAVAPSSPAPAPYQVCDATVPPPKDTGGFPGSKPNVFFDPSRTAAEREGDPAACCYRWTIPCPGGRPLRGDHGPVVAVVARRDDWLSPEIAAFAPALDPSLRAALADHWEREAAFEHASIASFARASLALLAVAAPPDLVEATHTAAIDEIDHARIAYALASAYAGSPRGPGALPVAIAALPADASPASLAALAVETFVDACAGESIAALSLREARDAASPALAAILDRIADDEERHAELAWRTVAWAAREGGDPVRRALAAAMAELRAEAADRAPQGCIASRGDLASHGVLDAAAQAAIRRRAIVEIVLPCAEALLAPRARAPLAAHGVERA